MTRKNKKGAGRPSIQWTKERISQLKKLYPSLSNEIVADKMGLTISAIRNAAIKYKIKKADRFWDKPWEEMLVKNWEELSVEELGELLARKFKVKKTKWSIINKYRELTGKR